MKPRARILVAVLLWMAIYLVGLRLVPILGPVAGWLAAHPWFPRGEVTQITFLACSILGFVLLRRRFPGAFGFRTAPPREVAKVVGQSGLVALALVLLGSAAMMLSGVKNPDASHPMIGGGLGRTVLTVWIVASICEEIFYRGLIQGLMDPGFPSEGPEGRNGLRGNRLPVLISALTFGGGHLCLLGAMPFPSVALIVVMASCLGWIAARARQRTGSLIPAIAAHMVFNVVGTLVPLLMTGAPRG